jgi:acetyltransferase-like isoleucine patch superfamily enzyme
VFIGEQAIFLSSDAKIIIGNNVMFGPHVFIVTGDHRTDVLGEYMSNIKNKLPENDKDVIIEDDVWIGMGVIILKGVRIGRGSVVGAGSIVTKDIPPYTIHLGSSGVKEFPRFTCEEIEEHERILNQKYNT